MNDDSDDPMLGREFVLADHVEVPKGLRGLRVRVEFESHTGHYVAVKCGTQDFVLVHPDWFVDENAPAIPPAAKPIRRRMDLTTLYRLVFLAALIAAFTRLAIEESAPLVIRTGSGAIAIVFAVVLVAVLISSGRKR